MTDPNPTPHPQSVPDDSPAPPSLDPVAVRRWMQIAPARSPWLHEEVGRRMAERLTWLKRRPQRWAHWEPVRGGLEAHALVAQACPDAKAVWVEPDPARAKIADAALAPSRWHPSAWRAGARSLGALAPASVDMLWSNMALHWSTGPQALLKTWHEALAVDGVLMFSCFGPDTLMELRSLYAELGWPTPTHAFTDMHDWGDMLLQSGFGDPVMDMQRITLTFASPERLLAELRELGRNMGRDRQVGLRGRAWLARLHAALAKSATVVAPSEPGASATPAIALSFEVIFGHAIRTAHRASVKDISRISLDDMRGMLQRR